MRETAHTAAQGFGAVPRLASGHPQYWGPTRPC